MKFVIYSDIINILVDNVNNSYLIEQAQKDGKYIFIPKTYSQGRMDFVEYNPDDLVKTRFGVWEPGTYSQSVD